MRSLFKFLMWTAIVAAVVIGGLRLVAIRWWKVPSDDPYLSASVSPTLRAGDLILLWRATKPAFGDLVLCPEPKRPDRVVIGRLVGEDNDVVEVKGSTIVINLRRQTTTSRCSEARFTEADPSTGIEVEQGCDMEELGGGTHERGNAESQPIRAQDVKAEVPPGYVWLVSDNRLFPYDSRDFGPVARETCEETVFFRLVGAAGFFDTSRRNQYIR